MSKSRPEDERAGSERERERERATEALPVGGGEAWDPLASVRKTISPTQRIQLLKMQVPVLPPEDFMDTADFQRGRAVRSRRFIPLVLGLAGALLILLSIGLWSRFSSSHDESTPSEFDSARPHSATLSHPIPAIAAPHLPAQSPPTQPLRYPHDDQPISPKVAATPSTPGLVPAKPLNPKRQTNTDRAAVAPEPKSSTSPTPEPAPSGIKFWTQPR